jgi:hypothetical protein
VSMAATAAQRLRAGRLRRRSERGTLTAAERRWLDWYDEAHPAPALATSDREELIADEPSEAPEPAAPPVEMPPTYVPGAAQRSSRSDIVDDAMRSAVNAQVASLEAMERTMAMLLRHSEAMSASHIALTEQLVDALTMLAERGERDLAERDARAEDAPSASDAVVTQLIQRMGGTPPT